jgi:hypothetical protein
MRAARPHTPSIFSPRGRTRLALRRYQDRAKNSGVSAYQLGREFIVVQFRDGSAYLYTHERPGRVHVEAMKRHALAGNGLATYINQHVRSDYAKRLW